MTIWKSLCYWNGIRWCEISQCLQQDRQQRFFYKYFELYYCIAITNLLSAEKLDFLTYHNGFSKSTYLFLKQFPNVGFKPMLFYFFGFHLQPLMFLAQLSYNAGNFCWWTIISQMVIFWQAFCDKQSTFHIWISSASSHTNLAPWRHVT